MQLAVARILLGLVAHPRREARQVELLWRTGQGCPLALRLRRSRGRGTGALPIRPSAALREGLELLGRDSKNVYGFRQQ